MAPAPADAGAGGRDAHYEERLSRLRGQNQQIINETVALKAKFRKSLQLLHVYQSKLVQVAEPPVARAGASTLLQSLAPGTANIARGAAQTVKPAGGASSDDSVGCDSTAAPQHAIAKGTLMPAGGLGASGNGAGPLADLRAAPEGTDVGPIAPAPRAQLLSPGAAAGPADGRQPQSAESLNSPPPFNTPPRPDEGSSTAHEHTKPVLAQPQPQQPLSALTPAQLQKLALEAKRALDERSRAYEAWTSGPAPLGARSLEVGQSPQLPLQPPVHSGAGARAEAGGHAVEKGEGQHPLSSSELTAGRLSSHEGGEAEDAGISTPPARALPPPSPLARATGRGAQAEAQQRAPDPQLPEEPLPFEPRTTRLARSPAEVPRADGWAGAGGRAQAAAAEAAAEQRTPPQRLEPSGSRAREASRPTAGPAGPPAAAANAALSVLPQRGTLIASEREPRPAPCAPAATQRGYTAGNRGAEPPPLAAPRQHAAGARAAQPPDLRPRGASRQEVPRARAHGRSHGEAGSPERAGPGEGGSQGDSDSMRCPCASPPGRAASLLFVPFRRFPPAAATPPPPAAATNPPVCSAHARAPRHMRCACRSRPRPLVRARALPLVRSRLSPRLDRGSKRSGRWRHSARRRR